MDKLKKQIFLALAVLLLLSAGALALLVKQAPNHSEVEQLPQTKETATPNAPLAQDEVSPAPTDEDALARFFDKETNGQILAIIKNSAMPTTAYALGMSSIINKHNQLAHNEIQEYKQVAEQLWHKYHPQAQAQNNREPISQPAQKNTPLAETRQPTPEAPADTLARTPQADNPPASAPAEQELPALNQWKNVPCQEWLPTDITPKGISCMESKLGFCARFENGRPYFCQTKDGQMQYMLNQWGSSITVKQHDTLEKTFYYADGKLTRYTQKDPAARQITQVWLSDTPLRMTLTDLNGKVLDKYYFTPAKPYVRYPGGNDMGEENGPWEEKDGQIWTDGRPLFTLPDSVPAPDVCRLFPGVCKTQDGKELL